MYTDPNTIVMSLPVFAALLAALTGILLFLSRQVRPHLVRIRLRTRHPKQDGISKQDEKSGN